MEVCYLTYWNSLSAFETQPPKYTTVQSYVPQKVHRYRALHLSRGDRFYSTGTENLIRCSITPAYLNKKAYILPSLSCFASAHFSLSFLPCCEVSFIISSSFSHIHGFLRLLCHFSWLPIDESKLTS